MPKPERDNWRGIRWMMFSVVTSSAMTVAARSASLEMDSRMIVFMRAGITVAIIVIAVILISPLRKQLRFSLPKQHILRGIFIGLSTQLGFYTIAHIPLATTTVLFFTAPIFATLLGMLLHGESIGPRRIAAILAGFIGTLVVLRPGMVTLEFGLLTALGSSLMFAAALNMSRNLAEADGPLSTFFSSMVVTVFVSLPIAAPVMEMPGSPVTWIAMAILIVTGTMRSVGDIQAYRHAEAAILAPITYMRLVFIGLGGYFLFDEVVDGPTLIGAAIIIGATLYITRREAALRRKAKS